MLPHTALRALGAAVFLLPVVSAHMQMLIPSPLRDPNSNRKDEPKDYNILTPLHADGSDFACKGYQWNTPWTTVATYEAGKSYKMTLKGSATHGGGSCQLSLSCDGGIHFKVIKSIVGGCPMEKQYPFTIPPEFAKSSKATCLFAWTWFNKIGNREMYMNCAVVDIVPSKRSASGRPPSTTPNTPMLKSRGISRANAAAQSLLAGYPDLFVANLKNVNSCTVKETMYVIFDDPGHAVSFGDGASGSSSSSFKRGVCTGAGLSSAESSAYSSTSSTGGWKESENENGGQDWTWKGGDSSGKSKSDAQGDDGMWHGGSQTSQNSGGNGGQWQSQGQTSSHGQQNIGAQSAADGPIAKSQQEQTQANLRPVDLNEVGLQPDANVQTDLDAYLAKLYGKSTSSQKRDIEDFQVTPTQDIETNHQNDELIQTQSQDDQASTNGRFENPTSSDEDPEESYHDISKSFRYHGTYAHRRRTNRKQRWESYNQRRDEPSSSSREATSKTEAASSSEASPDNANTTENHQGAALVFAPPPSKSDLAYYAILAKLNSLGDTVFTLIKFASTYLDGPPPPGRYIFAAVSSENGTITTLKKRDSSDDVAEKASLRATLVKKLSSLQDEVYDLINSAESKKSVSTGAWSRIKRSFMPPVWKRQLLMPGIIPSALQNNGSLSYFAEPMTSEAADNKQHHQAHSSAQNGSKPHATLEDTVCTFNLSLIDRCMSNPTFLSTVPSDNGAAPTTANLLDALHTCASADAECASDEKSTREDGLAPMNDSCQGIFMTISHCLLDDKDTKRVWNTLPLSNISTLESTPLRGALYTCVQKNVFCAPDTSKETEDLVPFNPLNRCDEEDLKCQAQARAYAAKLTAEMKKPVSTAGHQHRHHSGGSSPGNALVHCAKTDLGCIAHAKLQELKHAALSQRSGSVMKRQHDDGVDESGAAEVLFPKVSHDELYDGLEDESTAQPYDWDSVYGDVSTGSDDTGRTPAVVGAEPVQEWAEPSGDAVDTPLSSAEAVYTDERTPPIVGAEPFQDWASPSEDLAHTPSSSEGSVYTGDREPPVVGPNPIQSWPSPSEDPVYTDERLPPVVGPTPVTQWGPRSNSTLSSTNTTAHIEPVPKVVHLPTFQLLNTTSSIPGTAIPTPSQTAVPAIYNGSNSSNQNITLGEALKLAFPELINHPPVNEPVAQPPKYTQPQEEDAWRDGVFPGLLGERETAPLATPTRSHRSHRPTPTANDDDAAAILPYILGPGPAQPPGVSGTWPSAQETEASMPDNLEHMPQVFNDLTPEDEDSVRAFFSELAAQRKPTATATATAPGTLETLPALVNDLTDEDEADVLAFFSSLSPSPSPTQRIHPRHLPPSAPS